MNRDKLIVEIWGKSYNQHYLESALTILYSVFPQKSKKDFARMDIGIRNFFLYQIREKLFGKNINFLISCPNCGEKLESEFELQNEISFDKNSEAELFEFLSEGYNIKYRLPNSFDLASASICKDVNSAREKILNCCINESYQGNDQIPPSKLPEEIILELSEEMSDKNPYSETLLNLTCQACKHTWTTVLDIALFLFKEIDFYAQNILRDIHLLASAYHWSEEEIINMNVNRKNWYINLIGT